MQYRKPRTMTERQGRALYKHIGRILARAAQEQQMKNPYGKLVEIENAYFTA